MSDNAHPSIPVIDRIFEPLIGEWDLRVRWYVDGEIDHEMAGEWSSSRVLEGRGIQDVWIVPPRGQRDEEGSYEFGTSIRYYEPGLRAWRSTWIGPMQNMIRTFSAHRAGDDIVLETDNEGEGALRWVFSNIQPDRFVWRNHVHSNGEWRLQQDFLCTRKS